MQRIIGNDVQYTLTFYTLH